MTFITYLQIYLGFYSPYVAKLEKNQDDAQYRLCGEAQLQQEHEIIECQTTITSFHKCKPLLKRFSPLDVDDLELVVVRLNRWKKGSNKESTIRLKVLKMKLESI